MAKADNTKEQLENQLLFLFCLQFFFLFYNILFSKQLRYFLLDCYLQWMSDAEGRLAGGFNPLVVGLVVALAPTTAEVIGEGVAYLVLLDAGFGDV